MFYPPLRGSQPSARRARSNARRLGKEAEGCVAPKQPLSSLLATADDNQSVDNAADSSIAKDANGDHLQEQEEQLNESSTARAAVTLIGAGRTDAGVHARAQVLNTSEFK